MAVSHALTIIRWQENLLEGEMPPEWMWPLNDELNDWFAQVEADRQERFGDPGGRSEPLVDAPDMMQNALAVGRGGR